MWQVTVQPKEGIPDHWVIFIQGEKWCDVHRSVFGKHPSFSPVSSWEEWQKNFNQVEYQRVKNYVIWRLSSQSYHSEQLSKLLKERLVQKETIIKILQDCQQWGYLNDEQWVQLFMKTHQSRYSLRLILIKLRQKGLKPDTLEQIAQSWHQPKKELAAIQQLISKKYCSKNLKDFKERQKVVAALIRKGFQYDQVSQVLKTRDSLENDSFNL